jgi:peptidoglycan pentaglycine glycine transferase (the first glycine)
LSGRVLVLDQATSYPLDVCRKLAQQGYAVDVFGRPRAPAFRSRACAGRYLAPPWYEQERFVDELTALIEEVAYDAIFLSSEEILYPLLPIINHHRLRGLLLPPEPYLRITLSKNSVIRFAEEHGIPVPRTVVPKDPTDSGIGGLLGQLAFPILIKGERGGGSHTVRVARSPDDAVRLYSRTIRQERGYRGIPALQEFIRGPIYVVGGLIDKGVPLRLCAHKILLMNPPSAGATVHGVTARPSGLLETACRAFAALHFTGLGQLDFVYDPRDGQYKLLEINPRLWATIGLARRAGVDLYTPYLRLARGEKVEPDLGFEEGVQFHRLFQDIRSLVAAPLRIFGLLRLALDRGVPSDVEWRDLGPHFPVMPGRRPRPVRKPSPRSHPGHGAPDGSGLETAFVADAESWDSELKRAPNHDLRQSYRWGEWRLLAGWTPYRLATTADGRTAAMLSITARRFKTLGLTVLYGSRATITCEFTAAWPALGEALRELATRTDAAFLRVSPVLLQSGEDVGARLRQCGFRELPDFWTVWNAPRVVMSTPLGGDLEKLRASIRGRFRSYISSAPRRGLAVRLVTHEDDVKLFHRELAASARAKGYPVRRVHQFLALWQLWMRDGHGVVFLIEKGGAPVGGLLGIRFGDRAHMLYSWVSTVDPTLHQGPALYWEFIRWAKSLGCTSVDWGGSGTSYPPRSSDSLFGLYQFKSGLGAELECLPSYHDLVFRPRLYGVFRAMEKRFLPHSWAFRSLLN